MNTLPPAWVRCEKNLNCVKTKTPRCLARQSVVFDINPLYYTCFSFNLYHLLSLNEEMTLNIRYILPVFSCILTSNRNLRFISVHNKKNIRILLRNIINKWFMKLAGPMFAYYWAYFLLLRYLCIYFDVEEIVKNTSLSI